MNQDQLVSVIVPVYNVEAYLLRCIESIVNQTYKKLEILLVDDGSLDKCGQICDEWAEKDRRVTAFHKENGGLSDARNYALDRMNGAYVTFIDSDDFVDEQFVSILMETITESGMDIAMSGFETVYDGDTGTKLGKSEYKLIPYPKEEMLRKNLKVQVGPNACGKLYRKKVFNTIRFPKGLLYEDLAIVYDVLEEANGMAYVEAPLYKYYTRENSIMNSKFNMHQMDEIMIIDRAMDKLERQRPDLHTMIEARRIYSYFMVLSRILYSEQGDEYAKQKREIEEKIKAHQKGVLSSKDVKISWKIRLIGFQFGEKGFFAIQKMVDRLLLIKKRKKI